MKNILVAIIIVASILALCAWALSMATEYGPGPVVHQPTWPDGLAGVLNSHERVYGYWVNYSEDHIFYSGNAEDFASFVRGLTELRGSPVDVTVHRRPGYATRIGGSPRIPFDWEVVIIRDPHGLASGADISVHLWTGRNIPQSAVAVLGTL